MNAQQKYEMFQQMSKSHQQLVEFAKSITESDTPAAPRAKPLARALNPAEFTDEERAALGNAFNEINNEFAPPAKKQRKEEAEDADDSSAAAEEEEDEVTVKWGAYGEVTEEEMETLKKAVEEECINAVDNNKLKDRDMKAFMCDVFKWKGSYCQRSRKRGDTYTARELLNIEKIATFIHLALPHFEKEIKARGPHLSGRLGTIRSVLVFNEDEDAPEDKKKTIPDDEKIPIELERNPLHVAFKSTEQFDKMVELIFKSVIFFRETLAKPTKAAAKAAKAAAIPEEVEEKEDEQKKDEEADKKEEEETK
jgi:hypothetical protein